MIAIDCNGLSLLIFEENLPNYEYGPKSVPNSDSFWVHRLFNICLRVFCASNAPILLVNIPAKIKIMEFSFLPKNVHFILKNAVLCLFLKNVSPSKRVICFILNNLHFPMVEGIAFYALYKSRVLIIPCKADDFCLLIELPDET